mgnify:FL=1
MHSSPAVLFILLVISGARGAETGFIQRSYTGSDGLAVRYSIYIPPDYSPDKSWPVVLFLHGAGQAGTDGFAPTRTGLGKAIRNRDKPFPAIVVFPQAQKRERDILSTWHPDRPEGQRALAILDQVQKDFRIDPQRVYLTGISMGGYGAWALASRHPERFAAIVPICGGGDRDAAGALKSVPCWCFHGSDDPAVRVDNSRRMIDALKQAGGKPRYTEYPGVRHNCWDQAYATDELWTWLLEQRRPRAPHENGREGR